jgi:hypothetical protein
VSACKVQRFSFEVQPLIKVNGATSLERALRMSRPSGATSY